MKILFAVSNENVSKKIVENYEQEYQEKVSFKNVFYFNAIIREIKNDKTYDRIVISEDLEPFSNSNYDVIDKFILERLKEISYEANALEKIPDIIIICTDRRTKGGYALTKMHEYGVYNALIGTDRTIEHVCELIDQPHNAQEAKAYYQIEAGQDTSSVDDVTEQEVQNILIHYKRLGKNENRYADSFNNIAAQYTDKQLKIIIKCLPINVRAVLEAECPKYQELITYADETDEERRAKQKLQEQRRVEQIENDRKLRKKLEKERKERQKNAPKPLKKEGEPESTLQVQSINQEIQPRSGIDVIDNKNAQRMTGNVLIPENMNIRNERKIYTDDEIQNMNNTPREGRMGDISQPPIQQPNQVAGQVPNPMMGQNQMQRPMNQMPQNGMPGQMPNPMMRQYPGQMQRPMNQMPQNGIPGQIPNPMMGKNPNQMQRPMNQMPQNNMPGQMQNQQQKQETFELPVEPVNQEQPNQEPFELPVEPVNNNQQQTGNLPGIEEFDNIVAQNETPATTEKQKEDMPFELPVEPVNQEQPKQEPFELPVEPVNNNQQQKPIETVNNTQQPQAGNLPGLEEFDNIVAQNETPATTENQKEEMPFELPVEPVNQEQSKQETFELPVEPVNNNQQQPGNLPGLEEFDNIIAQNETPATTENKKEDMPFELPVEPVNQEQPKQEPFELPVEPVNQEQPKQEPFELPVNPVTPEENIQESQLEMPDVASIPEVPTEARKGRGRPRKYPIEPPKPKGKRGRPRKNQAGEIEDVDDEEMDETTSPNISNPVQANGMPGQVQNSMINQNQGQMQNQMQRPMNPMQQNGMPGQMPNQMMNQNQGQMQNQMQNQMQRPMNPMQQNGMPGQMPNPMMNQNQGQMQKPIEPPIKPEDMQKNESENILQGLDEWDNIDDEPQREEPIDDSWDRDPFAEPTQAYKEELNNTVLTEYEEDWARDPFAESTKNEEDSSNQDSDDEDNDDWDRDPFEEKSEQDSIQEENNDFSNSDMLSSSVVNPYNNINKENGDGQMMNNEEINNEYQNQYNGQMNGYQNQYNGQMNNGYQNQYNGQMNGYQNQYNNGQMNGYQDPNQYNNGQMNNGYQDPNQYNNGQMNGYQDPNQYNNGQMNGYQNQYNSNGYQQYNNQNNGYPNMNRQYNPGMMNGNYPQQGQYVEQLNNEENDERVTSYSPSQERRESLQALEESKTYSTGTLNQVLTKDKKVVAFVGASKSGTSFLVNNLACLFSSIGIKTAILDMTVNKNSFFIYTNNDDSLRNVAYASIENLEEGIAEGIRVDRNLNVYTSNPNDYKKFSNAETILSTLVQNESLVLIDCDFETDLGYFANAQEIYLVQSMDILTIQPLTAFLRDLKTKGILDPEKIRIVINKELKVKGLSSKAIIGGMSFYNDPAMSYMTELFNKEKIRACSIPFDENVYSKYLEALVNCTITISGYNKSFMNSLKILGNMVYPLLSKQTYSSPKSSAEASYGMNNFSTGFGNTLNQMKNKY